MAKEYEEKTAFITSQRIFCYSKMPFGLKNFGSTYQRLVDKAFQKQIGQNLEAYVDDLVIKSCTEQEVIRDVEETFKTLRKINMKLNPKNAPSRRRKKQFCSPSSKVFEGRECKELNGKLATAKEAISAILMTERDGKQIPIYFISRALRGPEINYTQMEKLVLALSERPEDNLEDTLMEGAEELPDPWTLFTDGSSCADGSGAGLILTNPEGMKFTYALRFRFDATNNEAVPRNENKKADALSKIASTSFAHLSKQVLVEELKEKSISAAEVLVVVDRGSDRRMIPIFKYSPERTLPAEGKKARAVKRKSWRFSIINGILYKKSFLEP
ncbi:reverse transcriptase domain-containing protein [Tanacetum coccineum]